jgi:Na+/proline symporter
VNAHLIGILAYVALQVAIGMAVSRRVRTEEDYLLAGRRLGPVLATASIFATWFGAETCMGGAGAAYERGRFSLAQPEPFAYGACLLVMGLLFARALWNARVTTLADLFRRRFSPGVERLAALLMVPTSILWAAAQVRAFGQVIAASSTMSTDVAIVLATGAVLVYTVSGGLLADAVTDVVQGVAVIFGLVLLAAVVFVDPAPVDVALPASAITTTSGISGTGWLTVMEDWAVPIMGSVFAQELVARVCAARSPRVARGGALVGGASYVAVGSLALALGAAGARLVPGLDHPEQVLSALAQQHMHGFLYVLFAGALVSAILSTADSTLLVAGSLTSHNLILPVRPGLSEAAKVRFARMGVVFFGLAACALALRADSVSGLVEQASSLGSSGIFVVALMSLTTRWGGKRSAYAALALGMCVYLLGILANWRAPYLASLLAAFAGYAWGALRAPRMAVAPGSVSE